MNDFHISESVEKYDSVADSWSSVFFTLPLPLAKLGACVIDRTSFLICGGMSADFESKRECYNFSLEKGKWS
jgi:N-acetylneuraminic acid mutarotase